MLDARETELLFSPVRLGAEVREPTLAFLHRLFDAAQRHDTSSNGVDEKSMSRGSSLGFTDVRNHGMSRKHSECRNQTGEGSQSTNSNLKIIL